MRPTIGTRSVLVLAGLSACAPAPNGSLDLPAVAEFARDLEVVGGPFPVYVDRRADRVFLALEDLGTPILHIVALSSGLDWPLDTGAMPWDGSTTVLRFGRSGSAVVLTEEGARSTPRSEPRQLPIVAVDSTAYLVDASAFFIRDAFNVARDVEDVGESAEFVAGRSGIVWPPPIESARSTNLDVRTTFRVPGGSRWVDDRSSDPEILTVVQRHMLVPAPSGFVARTAPGGMGFNALAAVTSEDDDAEPGVGWIQRWRLAASDPRLEVQPLDVFIDGSVPEEHKPAVREGLAYWTRAFARLGLREAIRIRDLPRGADLLSLDHPVVLLWSRRRQPIASQVHSAADPRSGELLKSIVLLDSHWPSVARNEYRSYRPALLPGSPSEAEYVEARLTWLVAHETGHLIAGLSHTGFQGTMVGFRVPRLAPARGRVELDLGSVLPGRPFPYDVWSLAYAYREWPDHQQDSLESLLADGLDRGLRHIGYEAGRLMPGAASRIGDADVIDGLQAAVATRSILLDRFGPSALDPDEPPHRLYERLVPVYFHHRFALEGVARVVGGMRHAADGAGLRAIPAAEQREALELLADMLAPAALAIPRRVIQAMPSMPDSSEALTLRGETERPGIFRFQTGSSYPIDLAAEPGAPFRAEAWARSLAEISIGALLHPSRVSRLQAQVADDPSLPSLAEVVGRLLDRVWWSSSADGPEGRALQRIARRALVFHLVGLAGDNAVGPEARATIVERLTAFRERLSLNGLDDPEELDLTREVLEALGDSG